MKQMTIETNRDVLTKIESIEKEIMELKLAVLKQYYPSGKRLITLRGIVKGIDISDKDIATAKKSLNSKMEI
jgi:hypothetical protein